MTKVIFIWTLSALFGYAWFVGTSGRLNPVNWPADSRAHSKVKIQALTSIGAAILLSACLLLLTMSTAVDLPLLVAVSLLTLPTLCLIAFFEYQHRSNVLACTQPPNTDVPVICEGTTHLEKVQPQTAISDKTCGGNELGSDSDVTANLTLSREIEDLMVEETELLTAESADNTSITKDSENTEPTILPSESSSSAALLAEIELRKETEKHLKITRRALSVLETEVRDNSISHTSALLNMQKKLALSLEASADLKSGISKERARTLEALNTISRLKKKQIQTKLQIQKSTAARAKALSTANKTIAFARESLQIRAALETELKKTRSTLSNQEKTINQLTQHLEQERSFNQTDVEAKARQLILREKREGARVARAQVIRGVEHNLSKRLVKKVAKARSSFTDESDV